MLEGLLAAAIIHTLGAGVVLLTGGLAWSHERWALREIGREDVRKRRAAARQIVMAPIWPIWLLMRTGPLVGRVWHDAVKRGGDD